MTRYLVPDPLTSGYETLLSSTVQLYFARSTSLSVFTQCSNCLSRPDSSAHWLPVDHLNLFAGVDFHSGSLGSLFPRVLQGPVIK